MRFYKALVKSRPSTVQKLADGQLKDIPRPLNEMYPVSVLAGVRDKDVLCLAAGGGQQSAVFGLLGAHVTVVDIADGQLAGDQKAANHYGYKVKTIQGDMNDLSSLKDESFDLVYQAPSMGYIADVKKVYSEVARVLRSGGLYRADGENPLAQFVDESTWNGKGYCITVPYETKEKQRSGNKNVIEYRHYLDEIFQSKEDKPGSWGHSLRYISGIFAILARKKY